MRVLPHIIAVLHVPFAVAAGLLVGDLTPVMYAGGAFELGTDPVALFAAVLVGIAVTRWWQLLLALLGVSCALHLYITIFSELATGSALTFFCRASAMATVAFAVNLIRLILEALGKRSRPRPDPI